jgi:hypothetical protein
MSYYRTLDREAFAAFRKSMRKDGNIVPLFGQREARYDDLLWGKDELAFRIAQHAVNGRILVCRETRYGPDYDGEPSRWHYDIPATVVHYVQWMERMQSESEGVDYYNIVWWDSAEIPTYWRKRGEELAYQHTMDLIIAQIAE